MTIQIVRRWAMVMAGVALLCGLPVIASALPVNVPQLTAAQLRTRILASADEPYAGYAETKLLRRPRRWRARLRYRPPSMVLTWNGCVSMWNWYISLATRWTRGRSMFGAMFSG